MRTISPALLAHLQADVRTVCTLWLITRTDGQIFGFTDFDQPITYGGVTYLAQGGYTHSQIESSSDLSTSNLELSAIFDSASITPQGLESGLWDYAAVSVSLVNYNDLTMGAAVLDSGYVGQLTIQNGMYKAELRGLAQLMQQDQGDIYSATCRAVFGDSKCTINLVPLTFTGSIQSVVNPVTWDDATLTQTGPNAAFVDTNGHRIPTTPPYTIKVVPPTGGAFVSNSEVRDAAGGTWLQVGGSPANDQYNVASDGTYTFDGTDNPGQIVFIDYTYQIGYFAYGTVKFLTGLNAGFSMDVKAFAPGVVTLTMTLPYPLTVGDTYSIVAGCDRLFGTCKARYNNVPNFRGEPYVPGQDVILRPQG
jgi:hypothetical protein